MALEDMLAQTEARMKKAIDALRKDAASVRTGRAAPSLVESLEVEAYGTPTPLIQLAAISAPEPRLLVVQVWDKGLMKAVEKAIIDSNLGLTPNNDGTLIRLSLPALTEERRKDLVKQLHKKIEEGRVELRTLRRHAHDEIRAQEKASGVSADDMKRLEAQLQKLTDRYILVADEIGQAKEKEILAV
ncbi:MAG: ribosome recycling factor [Chloroflexi bacterium]|nr:ribosome recycling factor [Chloroflexota bacterium]